MKIKSISEILESRIEEAKNWKDIVSKFDEIEDVIIQPNGKSIRVRGKKDGKFTDEYVDYNHKEVAKEVYDKLKSVIKEDLDEAKVTWDDASVAAYDAMRDLKAKGWKIDGTPSTNGFNVVHKNGCKGKIVFDPTF